jgi:hypothetical protein
MTDPNSLDIIMQEFQHIHDDINQIGIIIMFVGFILLISIPSKCKFKDKK